MSEVRPPKASRPAPIMYFVYILQSLRDKRTYVGYSNDFERRFREHNLGQSKSTKHRTPFILLFKEQYEDIKSAKARELWWKSGIGRKKLKEFFIKQEEAGQASHLIRPVPSL